MKVYKLFKYRYTSYCPGTADKGVEYALLHVDEEATFNNNRSTLLNDKHWAGQYEIDINSVEDLTI